MLKSGFGIRALSKSEIKKILQESEGLAAKSGSSGHTLEGLPSSESQERLQKSSHTFALKEVSHIFRFTV